MQEQIKCSRRIRNYLTQAGLPVTQKNVLQFNRGDNFTYILTLLLYSAMLSWPSSRLEIRLGEVLLFAAILVLSWTAVRQKQRWSALALNLKVNLIMFSVFLPLVMVAIFVTEKVNHLH